jgi:hypothetical protein
MQFLQHRPCVTERMDHGLKQRRLWHKLMTVCAGQHVQRICQRGANCGIGYLQDFKKTSAVVGKSSCMVTQLTCGALSRQHRTGLGDVWLTKAARSAWTHTAHTRHTRDHGRVDTIIALDHFRHCKGHAARAAKQHLAMSDLHPAPIQRAVCTQYAHSSTDTQLCSLPTP